MLTRLLRAPALHFLCLGALLLGASQHWSARPAGSTGLGDDELLYREAIALGIDRTDRAVHDRLVRLGGFVSEDAGDEAALESEARRLGLARSDLVVQRHLALLMRLAAERLRPEDVPTEATLRAELAAHPGGLAIPARTRFIQVYVSGARHGHDAAATAATLLDRLRHWDAPADHTPSLGDPFATGAVIGPATAGEIDRRFGPGFAARLDAVEPGTWVGPLTSPYGLHLVRVTERLPATTPSIDAVRGQVLHRVLHERREARARERIAALRAR
jgi:hypothetical protein